MYKHINSASRIHAVLSRAMKQGDRALFAVLAEAFEVKGTSDAETAVLVIPRLNWFYSELQLLESQARASSVSPHLYDHAFSRIRMVVSPLNLQAGWHGIRGNLTPDVLLAIAFLNDVLPNEESPIPVEELVAIQQELNEFREHIAKAELPSALKRFIEHQLQLIATALAQYPILGAKALREAGHSALGEIIETQGTVEVSQQGNEPVTKLGKLWKRVNSAADVALKVDQVAQLGHRAWQALEGWLQ